MTKTYRKTATIQAEQFDGSEEMMKRYGIRKDLLVEIGAINAEKFIISTLEGNMGFDLGDWVVTGIDGEHWVIKDSIFRKTYEEVTEDD